MIALADKISKSFGGQSLYTNATLQLNAGERWALVGPNGAGKTTLLKIIMGLESPDEGSVSFAKGARIGYLEQETHIGSGKSALQEVIDSATEIKTLEREIKELETSIAKAGSAVSDQLLERYAAATERFERLGGWELEAKAKQILAGLGFPVSEFDKKVEEFSGGWQMRISLSKLLLKHPDLLLLDEPSNHLDLESVKWLEGFLASYDGAVLLVSHDRAFMNAVVSHVAALENKSLVTYTGNYNQYLKTREANLEQLKAKRAAQERDIAHMQVFVDRFRYKPTKAKQVQERVKRIEQIQSELVVLPEAHKKMHFKFPAPPRTGDEVIALEEVSKHFGDKVVYDDVNLKLYRGDHVALVGPNGAGKSTLMKLICGKLAATKGNISYGQSVSVSYYAQHQLESLQEGHTVLQELDSVAPSWTSSELRRLLGAFLFHGDDIEKLVKVLSGGEKARLALAKMLVAPDPLLCLDEPTNHLDIDSVATLESALNNFPGTIVLISHDEELIRSVATKVVDVRDGQVTLYDGSYDYYLEKRAALEAGAASIDQVEPAAVASEPAGRKTKTKEQRRLEAEARNKANAQVKKEKKRLAELDALLAQKQERMQSLNELLASDELYQDQERFAKTMDEYQDLKQEIAALEEEWIELSALVEEVLGE